MNNEEILMELQQLNEQLQNYRAFYEEIKRKLNDINVVISALKEISKIKTKRKMLVPIANGIFLRAELDETAQVVVNVGADVCVNKSVKDTIKILEKRKVDVEKQLEDVENIIEQLSSFMSKLEDKIAG